MGLLIVVHPDFGRQTYIEAGFPPGTKPAAMVRASSPKIGEMELVLNDFRVALRTLERCIVRLQQNQFKEHTFLNRYLSLFNRASLWAYWEARLAGKLYRLHHSQNGDSKLLRERYWKKQD